MIFAALILFILAALFGMFSIFYVWQGETPPRVLAYTHGSFATLGIACLAIGTYSITGFWISLGLFILAALGGLYLFTHDLKGKKIPKLVATIHGLVAILAVVVLVGFIIHYYL